MTLCASEFCGRHVRSSSPRPQSASYKPLGDHFDHAEEVDTLGQVLRRERYRRELLQREVGRAAGIGPERLSRYESGVAVPSWSTFVRLLAAMGSQPRIVVEPLDGDVDGFIDRMNATPSADWLYDVELVLTPLLRLLDGLSWTATRLFAARLHGAPVPLSRLDVDVVIAPKHWDQLTRNAMSAGIPLRGSGADLDRVPSSPTFLRSTADAAADQLEWLLSDQHLLRMRVVRMLSPRCVLVQRGATAWPTVPLDMIASDDPWTSRVLARLRERANTVRRDSGPGAAYSP